jgi:hypothetical protein
MANIGAGETRKAWLIKSENVNVVDSMIKDTESVTVVKKEYAKMFKYRTLTSTEMTYQPLSSWLKGKYDKTIFTSDTEIRPKERDKILFEDGRYLMITRVLPQEQIGFFAINKKFPYILELE